MNPIAAQIAELLEQEELSPPRLGYIDPAELTFADIERDYKTVYGVAPGAENGSFLGKYRDFNFIASRKASRQPLPLIRPENLPQAVKRIPSNVWEAVRGLIDYYRDQKIDLEAILAGKINDNQANDNFFDLVRRDFREYWPLETSFDDIGSLLDIEEIAVELPYLLYGEEGVETLICFLEGWESAAGLLEGIYQEEDLENTLPPEDVNIIKSLGISGLMRAYVEVKDEQSLRWFDFPALKDHWNTYFGELFKKYPRYFQSGYFCIATENGVSMEILDKDAIPFAIGYCEAFEKMKEALPSMALAYNEEGEAENLLHHICEVYRAENGIPQIAWESSVEEFDPGVFDEEAA